MTYRSIVKHDANAPGPFLVNEEDAFEYEEDSCTAEEPCIKQ